MMIVLAFVYGLCLGSFANVLIWRLPREETITGRSHCPRCGHMLSWIDLLPLVSFFIAQGKCRYCAQPVSTRYPIIELAMGILFAVGVWLFPPGGWLETIITLQVLLAVFICVVVFVIDLEHYLILNKIMYPAMAAALALLIAQSMVTGSIAQVLEGLLSAAGASLAFWLLWFISSGRWMGFGDVKLAGWMGLVLGFPGIITSLFAAFIVGAVFGIILILLGKKELSSKLPFGTFLTVATVVTIFWGVQLWRWYWSLFIY
jgi:leader peptidase (prepilin peptidase) / N-methyltransferase